MHQQAQHRAPFRAAHAQPEFLWKAKHPARCSCRRKVLLSSFYVIILSNSANLFAKPPAPQTRKQCIHISSKRWMQWPLLPKPNAEPRLLFENSLLNQFILCKSTNCSACCLIIAHNSPAARTFRKKYEKNCPILWLLPQAEGTVRNIMFSCFLRKHVRIGKRTKSVRQFCSVCVDFLPRLCYNTSRRGGYPFC